LKVVGASVSSPFEETIKAQHEKCENEYNSLLLANGCCRSSFPFFPLLCEEIAFHVAGLSMWLHWVQLKGMEEMFSFS